jgi:hypothetical protein
LQARIDPLLVNAWGIAISSFGTHYRDSGCQQLVNDGDKDIRNKGCRLEVRIPFNEKS